MSTFPLTWDAWYITCPHCLTGYKYIYIPAWLWMSCHKSGVSVLFLCYPKYSYTFLFFLSANSSFVCDIKIITPSSFINACVQQNVLNDKTNASYLSLMFGDKTRWCLELPDAWCKHTCYLYFYSIRKLVVLLYPFIGTWYRNLACGESDNMEHIAHEV